ncbi:MAG: hypothetical protein U1E70_27740 [Acetobacteraceae bacterium]|nr:hypothetical protein [Pseudomonadota bacterium]
MSDNTDGKIADAGAAVQRQVNRADDAINEVTTFVRDKPITSVLIALGVGYILGKITS